MSPADTPEPPPRAGAGDDATGFNVVPLRYMGETGNHETIDRIRDMAGPWFAEARERGLDDGDAAFYVHCRGTALKYSDRRGKKGDPALDDEKAEWYTTMAVHLLGEGPDPRRYRAGFEPYTRPA